MKHCPVCKKELSDSARFCPFCMTSLIEKSFFAPTKPFLSGKRARRLTLLFLPLSGVFFCALFLFLLINPSSPNESPFTYQEETKVEELLTQEIDSEETKELDAKDPITENLPPISSEKDNPPFSSSSEMVTDTTKTPTVSTTPSSTSKTPTVSTTPSSTSKTPTVSTTPPVSSSGAKEEETPIATGGTIPNTSITWKLEGNTLTISGEGKIPGQTNQGGQQPWYPLWDSIEKVVIGEGIVTVGKWAFGDLFNGKELSLPSSLRVIEDGAFSEIQCRNLIIPEGVTSIGDAAFSFNFQLEEILLPGSLEVIPYWAFGECPKLRKVVLCEGIRTLEKEAFCWAPIEELYLPRSLTTVSEGVFWHALQSLKPSNVKTKVYYAGSRTEYQKISIDDDNNLLAENATFYYNVTY